MIIFAMIILFMIIVKVIVIFINPIHLLPLPSWGKASIAWKAENSHFSFPSPSVFSTAELTPRCIKFFAWIYIVWRRYELYLSYFIDCKHFRVTFKSDGHTSVLRRSLSDLLRSVSLYSEYVIPGRREGAGDAYASKNVHMDGHADRQQTACTVSELLSNDNTTWKVENMELWFICKSWSGQDPMAKCSDQTTWCLARYEIYTPASHVTMGLLGQGVRHWQDA